LTLYSQTYYPSLQDPVSYCYWAVLLGGKTTSYPKFSCGTGGIDEEKVVIIGVGIDHRLEDQY